MKTATEQAASRPGPGAGDGVLVDRHWLDAHLLDPHVRVVEVDVSAAAYGDGHIDGAVLWNIYADLKDAADGSFRSAAELRRVFSPAVLDAGRELITYCTIGGRAATAWLALTYLLGRDRVRVYDGSWAEWGRAASAPVEGH